MLPNLSGLRLEAAEPINGRFSMTPGAGDDEFFVTALLVHSHSGSGPNSSSSRYVNLGRVTDIEYDDKTFEFEKFRTSRTLDALAPMPAALLAKKERVKTGPAPRSMNAFSKAFHIWTMQGESHVLNGQTEFKREEPRSWRDEAYDLEMNAHPRGRQAFLREADKFIISTVEVPTELTSWRPAYSSSTLWDGAKKQFEKTVVETKKVVTLFKAIVAEDLPLNQRRKKQRVSATTSRVFMPKLQIDVPTTPDLSNGQLTPLKPDKKLEDVKGDGSCLYHCLVGLRLASSKWLKDDVPFPRNSETLKEMMSQYFISNYESVFMKNWASYLRQYLKVNNSDAKNMNPVDLAKRYAENVILKPYPTPYEYGGELEIDIAAHLFGVIIHKFERSTENVQKETALLTASFYPNKELSDEDQTIPKWVLVLIVNHFNYVLPLHPRNLKVAPAQPPSSSSSSSSSQTVRERADAMTRLRTRKGGESKPQGLEAQNMMLKRLAQERRERDPRQNSSPSCLLNPIERLGIDEQKQLEDLYEAMARRLQQEENRRFRQIEEDREFARKLADVRV